ncbi:MAG: type II toxin-antitoxin system VapC family toxin [Planctomycetes bacterium]|jgi:PIN domain nuclease of toxin-antitoxin system|nr:type II toxin-antitoxin system VapC family toxin [Planctomycetota bacterium]
MNLLLDTHTLLWFLADSTKLTTAAKSVIEDPANKRWLSPISLLEIAIKIRIDKLRVAEPFDALFPSSLLMNKIELIPILPRHIAPLTALPMYHRDPFDRLIAATAQADDFVLVSADSAFDRYGLARIW